MDDNNKTTDSNVGSPANGRSRHEVKQWEGSNRRDFPDGRESVRAEWEENEFASNGKGAVPFTPWPLLERLIRGWYWLLLGGCALAALGFAAGYLLWQTRYTATAQLLRFETPNNSELFKPRQLSEQTFASMLRSPELLRKVSDQTKPALSPEKLASSLTIAPERNSDVVSVSITALNQEAALNVANLFATEAVSFSKELQINEAQAANVYYTNQLADMEKDRKVLVVDMQRVAHEAGRTTIRPSQLTDKFQVALAEKLQSAREDLVNLLAKYTEIHPSVKEQRAKIEALQQQLTAMSTNSAAADEGPGVAVESLRPGSTNSAAASGRQSDFEILRTQLQALEAARTQLLTRQREAQLFQRDPPGYCRLFAPATTKTMVVRDRLPKLLFLTAFGAIMGILGTSLLLLSVEFMDDRLKTRADVHRVTRLPLLASLGNLHRIDHGEQENWAFRTWTALQHRLSPSPNHGLVCGITSAEWGEGRSTWIGLLANAASHCGFRVLTIGTKPGSEREEHPLNGEWKDDEPEQNLNGNALTTNVLSSPALVTEKLTGSDPQPFVEIPLPGWVWDLDRRKQWQTALTQWSRIENIVILVELPPSSVPEAVLLAENLPNLLWLTCSGAARASESRTQLETLRLARCHLVGAVLNRESKAPIKNRFQRWFGCLALLLGISLGSARAGDPVPAPEPVGATNNEPAATNLSFSVHAPAQRAAWQQRFTLGPGDILNFSLFGQPDLKSADVFIGPDGRIGFLQAQEIMAVGLTLDELRARFDEELAKYYRTPRTIITPVSFHSKKYYVLGKVAARGVYVLDRPLTIIEALARAKGLETGLLPDNRNMIDLADLQRSFLMRNGKRLSVNFEKLFQEGDLSQNVPLEPEDYLYFAAANIQQCYVLGEIFIPGPVPYTANLTAVGAIAARGGFTQRAYKGRVLVIRGSINHPQTFVVDVWKATEGRALDFKLEPKDIVYVNYRPFIKAEELLDLGITAFIQSATAEWTGLHVDPRSQ